MTEVIYEPQRVDILGVAVSAVDPECAVDLIDSWIREGTRTYVCVTGAHGVIESQHDTELLRIHNASGLTVPDGMPLVWSCRRAGLAGTARVYGPDLVLDLAQRGSEKHWSVFLYGGKDGIADQLGEVLSARFPGLRIAGTFCPPFRPLDESERGEVIRRINASGADLVLVGLSTPKQEHWMADVREDLDTPVLIGVGAAFDFHTGNARQAPTILQKAGLEWLFRALTEPRRLAKRYLHIVPRFIAGVIRQPPAKAATLQSESGR